MVGFFLGLVAVSVALALVPLFLNDRRSSPDGREKYDDISRWI